MLFCMGHSHMKIHRLWWKYSRYLLRKLDGKGDQTWRAGWPQSAERFWQLLEATWNQILMGCDFWTFWISRCPINSTDLSLSLFDLFHLLGNCGHWWVNYSKLVSVFRVPPSQGCVYSHEYWSTLVGLVKNRRATGEYLEAPQIMEEIEGIRENLT